MKSNFPTDSDGKLCGVDNPGYEYLYFANPPQIVQIKNKNRIDEFVYNNAQMQLIQDWPVQPLMMLDVNSATQLPNMMSFHWIKVNNK